MSLLIIFDANHNGELAMELPRPKSCVSWKKAVLSITRHPGFPDNFQLQYPRIPHRRVLYSREL